MYGYLGPHGFGQRSSSCYFWRQRWCRCCCWGECKRIINVEITGMSHSYLCLVLVWNTIHDTQLRKSDSLPRPVVLVESDDAEELMALINKNEEAIVRIDIMLNPPRWVNLTQQAPLRNTRITCFCLPYSDKYIKVFKSSILLLYIFLSFHSQTTMWASPSPLSWPSWPLSSSSLCATSAGPAEPGWVRVKA